MTAIVYFGLSAVFTSANKLFIGLAIHDGFRPIHFHLTPGPENAQERNQIIADWVIQSIQNFERIHVVKFVGAGLPPMLPTVSPQLCSRLWLEADVIPIILQPEDLTINREAIRPDHLAEEAESMAHKIFL